ncbi:ParB/RepB/Spo0J family partition protein [Nocardia tenerifensis]|nr:ParB/RepB/Spo0J family partition protein [Nocardia tenerifensis]
MSVADLLPSDSPRISGENRAHIKRLVESETPLPPILVHRQTMKVIDGMHRLRAAEMRRDNEIDVKFFDGDAADAFVLAVHANTAHGLPLSLAERKSAATRIIGAYPQWSDRLIASATGLSHKTVGRLRRRASGDVPQLHGRVGQDGRVRPLDSAQGRRVAEDIMREGRDVSLREIARITGLSPNTVRAVQARLHRGEGRTTSLRAADAATIALVGDGGADSPPASRPAQDSARDNDTTLGPHSLETANMSKETVSYLRTLKALQNDPAIRLNERGRLLLRRLQLWSKEVDECEQLLTGLPEHCGDIISKLARQNGKKWIELAERLERRNDPHVSA